MFRRENILPNFQICIRIDGHSKFIVKFKGKTVAASYVLNKPAKFQECQLVSVHVILVVYTTDFSATTLISQSIQLGSTLEIVSESNPLNPNVFNQSFYDPLDFPELLTNPKQVDYITTKSLLILHHRVIKTLQVLTKMRLSSFLIYTYNIYLIRACVLMSTSQLIYLSFQMNELNKIIENIEIYFCI